MKKRIICLVLLAAMLLSAFPAAAADFTDIYDPEIAAAAAVLQGLGILLGRADGQFAPDATLTRAEACNLIVKTMGLSAQIDTYARRTVFSDVKPGAWYTGCVNLAYEKGIISGYGDGRFGPNDTITYGQFATLVLRMLNYTSKEVGSVWPRDFTGFCAGLGLSEDLGLGDYDPIPRGSAALLLYRAILETPNGSSRAFYTSMGSISSTQDIILLSVDAASGGQEGLLMACALGATASVEYYTQRNAQSACFTGWQGTLLLNADGETVGFLPESEQTAELVLAAAKSAGITAEDGSFTRIPNGTRLILGEDVRTWNADTYLELSACMGRTAKLYYDGDGSLTCVRIAAAGTASSSEIAIAETHTALPELKRSLRIESDCAVLKNGVPVTADSLGKYDVAYYDLLSDTLFVSDFRVTGYLEGASPDLDCAETVTVAGCTFPVLESAWASLSTYALGKKVTLLFTDDGKVAAAMSLSDSAAEMYGVLSTDGRSVTLCGTGVTLRADTVIADVKLRGDIVRVEAVNRNTLKCYERPRTVGEKLNLTERTLGDLRLSPSCAIYEHAGKGYVSSLAGERGAASSDLSEIFWTKTLSGSYVSWYHRNEAGEVDVLLLANVTGNCYTYGKLLVYSDADGIQLEGNQSASGALSIQNGAQSGGSTKYLCNYALSSGNYGGIALRTYDDRYQSVDSVVTLTASRNTAGNSIFREDEAWYAVTDEHEIPVSKNVQVYLTATDVWLSGEDGARAALSAGTTLRLYYDRSFATGAQVRVIVVEETGN